MSNSKYYDGTKFVKLGDDGLNNVDNIKQLPLSGGTISNSLNVVNNVGIGTTTPNEKLDVAGNIRIRTDNELKFGGIGANDSNVSISYNSATKSLEFNFM